MQGVDHFCDSQVGDPFRSAEIETQRNQVL